MPHPRSVPGAGELLQRTGRWLEAPPEAVVELKREDSLRSVPLSRAVRTHGDAPAALTHDAAGLAPALAAWGDALAGARRIAVVRRALLLALTAAALLLLARAVFGGPPLAVAAVAAVGVFAVALLPLARRRPSPAAVARLLDRRLDLHETVATAWELERRGAAPTPLTEQVLDDGERLVRDARAATRVRPAPAPREWSLLAAGVAVVVALAVVGAPGDGSSADAPVRADAGSSASAAQPATTATRTTPSTPPTSPGATATTPAGTPRQPGASSTGAGATANGRDAAPGSGIAIRRQPARAGGDARGAGSGRGGSRGSGAGADGRAGTGAGSSAGRRSQSSVTPQAAASLPAPSQVKEFAAEGRRATAPLAAGAPSRSGRSAGDGARGAARSGTRGAGSQSGRSGSGTAARPTTSAGAEQLPLRLLAAGGGDQRGTSAGRASAGGRGRGAARVQGGVSGAAAGGPLELPFVPPAVNAVAPYLRALVAAYFPPR